MHEKYDWHDSQIFRLQLFVVVVKCQRFVRDEKNNFLEFRALEPYLTAAIIFAEIYNYYYHYMPFTSPLSSSILFFYSVINVVNVSREARHCQLIY